MTAAVTEAGVDTWRLNFSLPRTTGMDQLQWLPAAGGAERLADDVAGHRAYFYPQWAVLAVEGHPQADGLAGPEAMHRTYGEVMDALEGLDMAPVSFRGLSRLDATATQRFDDPRHGAAVLQGMAALDVPTCKPVVWGRPVETVGLIHVNGRRLLGRVYDKGREAGTAPPGTLVRMEDQRRFTSGVRPGVEAFDGGYVRERFLARFVPMWRSAKGVRVAGLPVLAQELVDRLERGELTTRQAERLGGFLVLELARAARPGQNRRTYYRRRAELREQGLVLADDFYEPVDVDLAEVLERAIETPMWGARG